MCAINELVTSMPTDSVFISVDLTDGRIMISIKPDYGFLSKLSKFS